MTNSYDSGLSLLNVGLFIINILSPFLSVAIIKHLKNQHGNESSILNWINLELIMCVSLLRPLVFLANKLGSIPNTNYNQNSPEQMFIVPHESVLRINALEERVRVLERSLMNSSKPDSPISLSPCTSLQYSSSNQKRIITKRSLLYVLFGWYFSMLSFLFRTLVPFSNSIISFVKKVKVD